MTAPTYAAITAAADKIFTERSAWFVAFAAAFAVWEVSRAVRIVGLALNEITGQVENRPFWRRIVVSLALAVVVIVCVALALLVVLVLGRIAASGGLWWSVVAVLRWPVGAVFLALAVGIVTNYAPVRSHGSEWATAGALLTVFAWLIASALFALYVDRIGDYQSAAGNLLLFLVVTGYLYLSAIVFLLGIQLDEFLREDGYDGIPRLLARARRAGAAR